MNLETAKAIGNEIITALAPFCHRCEVAGSTRRLKPDGIKDVEIVILPKPECARELADIINHRWGPPAAGKWPAKYTKIRGQYNLDIFTATKDTWGLVFFIRTGPAEYVTRGLAYWKTITNGGYSDEAVLHLADGTPVPTPEEEHVFQALEFYGGKTCRFVPPEKRYAEKVKRHD